MLISFFISPTFATEINNPATCDSGTLSTDTGPTNLRANYESNTLNLKWYDENGNQLNVQNESNTCTYGGSINLPTPPTKRGYTFKGWKVIPTYDFSTFNITTNSHSATWGKAKGGCRYCYNSNCSDVSSSTCTTYPEFANMDMETWRIQYSFGDIYGKSVCSTTVGDSSNLIQNTIDETGNGSYCWCKVTGYTPNGASVKMVPSNNVPWVIDIFNGTDITYGCDYRGCAIRCVILFGNRSSYRNNMLGITE